MSIPPPPAMVCPLTVHRQLQGDLSLQIGQVYSSQVDALLKRFHSWQPEGPIPSPRAPGLIVIPSSKCHSLFLGWWRFPSQPRSRSQQQVTLAPVLATPLQPKGRGTCGRRQSIFQSRGHVGKAQVQHRIFSQLDPRVGAVGEDGQHHWALGERGERKSRKAELWASVYPPFRDTSICNTTSKPSLHSSSKPM